jgi:hypothetical protein
MTGQPGKLLDYYFLVRVDPTVAIPARCRHILWLIENTPDDELAGAPAATIDTAGHWLADPQGFNLASDAWRVQVAKPDAKPAALANAVDTDLLAKSALDRAVSFAPGDAGVAGYREQYDVFRRQKLGARPAPQASPVAAAPPPPPREATADDLKKVAAGMGREELLKLGSPGGRITSDDDGHLIQVYQYFSNGARFATIRLTDGTVSGVELP